MSRESTVIAIVTRTESAPPAVLGGDLGRSDGRVGRIGQSTLEAAADPVPQARQPPRRGTVSCTR
jgi:hypothetical protein